MRKIVLLPLLIPAIFCGCISKPPTPQQQLAERLDFANSSSYRLISPKAARAMAEQYFTEAEFLGAQQKERQFFLELSSIVTVLYHASGLNDLLVAGESSRPLSTEVDAPVYLNCFSAAAVPDTQGFLWHLLNEQPQNIRPFAESLPANTLFAGCLELTPEALMKALEKYADTSTDKLNDIAQKRFNKSAKQLLEDFSGRWELILLEADKKLYFKLSVPDGDGSLSAGIRIVLPMLKRVLQDKAVPPQIRTTDGKMILASSNIEKYLEKSEPLVKAFPDLNYLLSNLPQKGSGFFYCSKALSKLFLPEIIVQRKKCKLPFSLGVIRSSGSSYDLVSLSNCDIDELQLFAAMLLPLREGMDHLLNVRAKDQQQNKAEYLRDMGRKQCSARLNVIGKKLQEYARKNHGKFPANLASLELDGSALLCPANQYSPYVYFYGFSLKENPKFPLVCDFLPHGGQVNVLLLNGEVHTLSTFGNFSLKRLIGILHSRFRYTEKELQMLLKKISTIDKNMEQ